MCNNIFGTTIDVHTSILNDNIYLMKYTVNKLETLNQIIITE